MLKNRGPCIVVLTVLSHSPGVRSFDHANFPEMQSRTSRANSLFKLFSVALMRNTAAFCGRTISGHASTSLRICFTRPMVTVPEPSEWPCSFGACARPCAQTMIRHQTIGSDCAACIADHAKLFGRRLFRILVVFLLAWPRRQRRRQRIAPNIVIEPVLVLFHYRALLLRLVDRMTEA